jgi:hypothetical protein
MKSDLDDLQTAGLKGITTLSIMGLYATLSITVLSAVMLGAIALLEVISSLFANSKNHLK